MVAYEKCKCGLTPTRVTPTRYLVYDNIHCARSTTCVTQLNSDNRDHGLKMAAVVSDVILFELLDMVMEEVYFSGNIMQYALPLIRRDTVPRICGYMEDIVCDYCEEDFRRYFRYIQ